MKLIFIRHGESIGNVTYGYISGRSDPAGLTHKGRVQVVRSAWELRDEKIDKIIASPVARALETARLLHCYFPAATLSTSEWLTELDHGIFEGRRWWEVIHKVPSAWRESREEYQTSFPEGESMEQLAHRVWRGYQEYLPHIGKDDTVVFVSHQAVISSMRFCLLHGSPDLITTATHQKEYVRFLKDVQLPNAGFISYVPVSKLKSTDIKQSIKFEQIKPRHNNISWYIKGLTSSISTPEAKRKETASGNAVYHVRISDTKSHIVKVLRGTDPHAAARQRKLYEYLASKKIHAPVVEYYDTSHSFYQNDVFIQDYIAGNTAGQCFKTNQNDCKKLLTAIYKTLKNVHSLPISEVKDFWYPPAEEAFLDWKTFMQYNINLSLHMLQLCELSPDVKQYIYKELSDLAGYLLSEQYRLAPIHGDAGTGNFIACQHTDEQCTLLRVIDFEWARIGDPLWDYAYFWGWVQRNHSNIADEWKRILEKEHAKELKRIVQYQLLFHVWTVRDMMDYKDESIRQTRGRRSLEILERIMPS